MMNTQGAVVLGMVYNYLPFMILPIYSVIIKLDGSLLEAARDLGNTLGRGCRIVSGKKKGRIELEYYGVDDLNELLEALHTIKKP